MSEALPGEPWTPEQAADGLRRGDFSRVAPVFGDAAQPAVASGPFIEWIRAGILESSPEVAAEALTAACWLGMTGVAAELLDRGVDARAGTATGMSALHWAANNGQLAAVRLLLERGVPLEDRNMYDATPLAAAVWASQNQPRGDLKGVITELVAAGANVRAVEQPTGDDALDALLRAGQRAVLRTDLGTDLRTDLGTDLGTRP